jgi:hypothetical protein
LRYEERLALKRAALSLLIRSGATLPPAIPPASQIGTRLMAQTRDGHGAIAPAY